MPFYIGNARCPKCSGHGFYPCAMCVGYRLHMPEPDPVHGPQPLDQLDVQMGTMRWLRQFPDSRRRGETSTQGVAPVVAHGSSWSGAAADTGEAVDQEALARAAYNFYVARGQMTGRRPRY